MKKLITAVVLAASFTNAFAGQREVNQAWHTVSNSPAFAYAMVAGNLESVYLVNCVDKDLSEKFGSEEVAGTVESYWDERFGNIMQGLDLDEQDEEAFAEKMHQEVWMNTNHDIIYDKVPEIQYKNNNVCQNVEKAMRNIGMNPKHVARHYKLGKEGAAMYDENLPILSECKKVEAEFGASEGGHCFANKLIEMGEKFAKGNFRWILK